MSTEKYIFEPLATVEIVKRLRQKNLRMRVKNQTVIVSAPVYCSKKVIQNFIKANEDWALRAVQKQTNRNSALKDELNLRKNQLMLRGIWKTLMPDNSLPNRKNLQFQEYESFVGYRLPPQSENGIAPEILKRNAHLWLQWKAKTELREYFKTLASELPFQWNSVFIRSQKTKWGTCSSKKNISLNWRLIKTPKEILDYLIVHELCHTVHLNHSKTYWNLVESHYPKRKEAERWLKEHEALIFEESRV